MQISMQEDLERLVLSAIRKGRWLAEDWRETGLNTTQPLSRLLPQTLCRLQGGQRLANNDESALVLMGEAIRKALNDIHPKYGDVVMKEEWSEPVFYSQRIENLRMLAERWKAYQRARVEIQDHIAALSHASWLLSQEA